MSELLSLEGVRKVYPDGTVALDGITLSVKEGEFLGVMGPSGSGKSTLLHIMGGLDKPSAGRVNLLGKELGSLGEDELASFRKGKIAYIFQFYYLMEDFNVFENLVLIGKLVGVEKPEERAREILKFLRLEHRLKHYPNQLSGGEQQRVAIGRALMVNPKLILADEPTGNVDSRERERIFGLFKKLNERGITFVVATHDEALKKYFSRIIKLRDGKVEEVITQS